MDQENKDNRKYPMAYSPISNCFIKEEPQFAENPEELHSVEQLDLEPSIIAYPPIIPRGVIKMEEPLIEERGDAQHKQVIAYPPIARERIKQELQSDVNQDEFNVLEGHKLDLEPIIAYPPIPRGVIIKEEPLEEKEGEEQQAKQVIAYPPIPRGRIKEECVDNHDDFNLEEHQLIPQEGGNQNLVDESTSGPITTATAYVSTADRGNGTKRRKSQRRKKIVIASTTAISTSTESDDQSAKLMPTTNSRTRRSVYQLKRGSTSMVSADNEGEKDDHTTEDRRNGAQRPKSKKRKVTASTADTPSSTGSGDQSAKTMSTISSRTRQLKRGSTSMTKDADKGKEVHSAAESDHFGGHNSDKTVPTISNTRSHHSKPGSASLARDDNGEPIKKRKVTEEKGIEEEKQQGTKDDKRSITSENFSLNDGDSSSSSDETSERPSGSHNKYICKECGRGFQRKCSLRLHFLNAHNGTGHPTRSLNVFKCDKCMKTYKSKKSLVRHLRNECRVDPAFPCPQCDYKATRKSNLRRHLISTHKVDSSQLDNVSADAALCVRPVLPFKCEKCEGTFKSKDSLYSHKKRVCGVAKSFSCVKCDYRTVLKCNLRKHLMDVHDVESSQLANYGAGKVVRPQLPFKCDKCERSYQHKQNLKHHMDLDCGKLPSFPCNQCGYRASRNANLKRHINTVHGASSSSFQA